MRRIALSLLFLAAFTVAGLAQTQTGTLLGTATDPSGAAIPSVEISVVHAETNYTQDAVTNEVGNYAISNLPVGNYTLTASFPGFETFRVDEILLQVGDIRRTNVELTVGDTGTTVNVIAPRSVVRTDDASIGIVVYPEQITGLPNNGGLFETLAQISPGVTTPAEGSELSTRGGFNSAGMDENSNSFFLDGFDNVDPVVRNLSFRPPLDMIQEFRIEQNAYSAEFGRNAGTVINVVTKSGTNGFHGSLSEDLRNDNLDARAFFASADGLPKPDMIRNQFAATFGGPIVPDRTFFFAAYEGLREKDGDARRATVPTELMRQGNFSELLALPNPIQLLDPSTGLTAPFAGNIIPSGDWDPIGAAVIQAYPLPNVTPVSGVAGNRIEIANHITNIDTLSGRIDHRLFDTSQLVGRFSFSDGRTTDPFRTDTPQAAPVFLKDFGQSNDITRTNVGIGLTTPIGNAMVHEFRAGFNRLRQEQIPLRDLPAEQAPIAGLVQRFLTFVPFTASTIGSGSQFSRVANVFNFIDQLTWITGNHQFKTGVDLRRYQFNGASSPTNAFAFVGAYTGFGPPTPFPGYGLADMLLGFPFQTISFNGDPEGHSRKTEFAAYFQDDWQVTDSLTLNYGIRWDWYGRIQEINDKQSTWDAACNCILLAGVDTSRQLVDDDWDNFAPRFGFAYRPFGDTTTVIRGGGGIYYDSEQRHNYFQIANTPFFETLRFQGFGLTLDDPFPGGSFPLSPNAIEQNYRDSYFEHWTLSIQHQVAPETVLEVAYVGNHGVKLQRSRDVNDLIPGVGFPYAGYGSIRLFEQAAGSIFHSLQTRLERRFSDRFGFVAGYTWGHSIDDRPAQGLGSIRSFQNHHEPGLDRADSDFDVRHRFTFSGMYNLPGTDYDGVLGQILNGWALNGILTLQSGRPFTVYMPNLDQRPDAVAGVDPVPANQGPDNWINPAAYAAPAGAFGTLGRNTQRGPGLQLVDISAVKGFDAGENNRLEFRAEFFNLFNHPNFGQPDPEFGSPTFGTIGTTLTSERQIQFGLRYDF